MEQLGALKRAAIVLSLLVCAALVPLSLGAGLEEELGRSEVRVRSAAYPLVAGRSVAQSGLVERLERLGYERVRQRPEVPGRFFYGHEVFWIYRHAHRYRGRDHAATLIGLQLREGQGMILGARGIDGSDYPLEHDDVLWLEPETIAESLDGDRADRVRIRLDELPEHAWRALLAAEDARFFAHSGVDGRSVARAALANLKKGGVAQGGSTITQQLIKNRELTPKRTFGRKISEAVRATMLEAQYDKREILQAYLNQVYYGHVGGLAIHGIGTAARAYFSKDASKLDLAESALLAAIIQGPNRLSPQRHPDRAKERRDWVLERLEELGWVGTDELERARRSAIRVRESKPGSEAPPHFLSWVSQITSAEAGSRLEEGRGVVVETTLDPHLQRLARRIVREQLAELRGQHARLRREPLSAALVALDSRTGDVLAYVGGDPAAVGDRFDRVRQAQRQPGSAIKPFVLLEAFEHCGRRQPLHPASRVADEPLRIDLPSGAWEPENYDRRFRGVIDVRTALAESRNVPLVRIARWCGLEPTARKFERLGLELPDDPPPSFVLGSVETTPLRLAAAYTVLSSPGDALEPRPVRRIEKPGGRRLAELRTRSQRVARPGTAYLVRDLMRSAVVSGTASVADLEGFEVVAKTGSSSELRDAWFAGHAGSVVTVVWVGLDEGGSLGLPGSRAAGPIWREFMTAAAAARPAHAVARPRTVVELFVDERTGLLVRERNRHARKELFRQGALPPRDRFWRSDAAVPVVR